MSFFMQVLIGTLIGIGMIIPGFSGAVLAVIFDVYDKILNSVKNLLKSPKKSFLYLLPIALGMVVGIFWFSKVLVFLYDHHKTYTIMSFIGLILGGIPYLFKETKKNGTINYFYIILSFIISIILFLVSKQTFLINYENNMLITFIIGFIYASGKIVPGISGTFILILFGKYDYVLNIISNLSSITIADFSFLIPFIFGFGVGVVAFINLIDYLIKNKFSKTYSAIIGLVISSIIVLIPKINSISQLFFGLIFSTLGFTLSYNLSKK